MVDPVIVLGFLLPFLTAGLLFCLKYELKRGTITVTPESKKRDRLMTALVIFNILAVCTVAALVRFGL